MSDAAALWTRNHARVEAAIDARFRTRIVTAAPVGLTVTVWSGNPDDPSRPVLPVAYGCPPVAIGDTVLTVRIGGRETVIQIITRP